MIKQTFNKDKQTNKQTYLSPVNFKIVSVIESDENVMKENRTPLLKWKCINFYYYKFMIYDYYN